MNLGRESISAPTDWQVGLRLTGKPPGAAWRGKMLGVADSGRSVAWPQEPWTVELLTALRAGGYRPIAWARFFDASWIRARATARHNPSLARAWRRL